MNQSSRAAAEQYFWVPEATCKTSSQFELDCLAWKPITTPIVSSDVLDTLGCGPPLPGGGGGGGGGAATRPVAEAAAGRRCLRGGARCARWCSRWSAGLARGARLELKLAIAPSPLTVLSRKACSCRVRFVC